MIGLIGVLLLIFGFLFMINVIIQGIKRINSAPTIGSIFKGCLMALMLIGVSIGLMWGGLYLINWDA